MPTKRFRIPTMIGEEDQERVENILRQTPGVSRVEISTGTKEIAVTWSEPATWRELERNLEIFGYVPDADESEAAAE